MEAILLESELRALIREALALEMDEGKGLADDIVNWCNKHKDINVDRTTKGHFKITVKGHGDKSDKRSVVHAAGTASDYRSDRNFRATMRRTMNDLGWTRDEIDKMPG